VHELTHSSPSHINLLNGGSATDNPVVIKIGGSLCDQRGRLCSEIIRAGRSALIIPGGGVFADQVRIVNPPPDAAHWMAIAAMEQTGWLLHTTGIPCTDRLERPQRTMVFLPYRVMRTLDPLPHDWNVTSDSIAAWAAAALELPLVLVKAVDGIYINGQAVDWLDHPVVTDVVDPFFLQYAFDNSLQVKIVNGAIPGRLHAYLAGGEVKGTMIGDLLCGHRTSL
jgi:aspartokinase-like uncharacterized kinase